MPKTIKTRSGRTIILPTPKEDTAITAAAMTDPDSIPPADADWNALKPLIRRGRPLGSGKKEQVSIRYDIDVLEAFRKTGEGWQTRMNDALREWLITHQVR